MNILSVRPLSMCSTIPLQSLSLCASRPLFFESVISEIQGRPWPAGGQKQLVSFLEEKAGSEPAITYICSYWGQRLFRFYALGAEGGMLVALLFDISFICVLIC